MDSLSILDKLSNEQAGILFKAIRDYNDGILPDLDFALDLAFNTFKNQFDRDVDKWLRIKDLRSVAGAKGGRQKVANVANATKTKQKPLVSVSDSVSVSVSGSVNDISFERFWNLYDKKLSHKSCLAKWNKLSDEQKHKIISSLPEFLKAHPDKQFLPYPLTYLNQQRWNDEIKDDLTDFEKRALKNKDVPIGTHDKLFG
jgi:hypothetical protein